jgi:hypothetical protein
MLGQTVIYDKELYEPYCTIESEYDVIFVLQFENKKKSYDSMFTGTQSQRN